MKKLYTVTIETEIVVVAESEEEAEEFAEEARDDLSSYDYSCRAVDMRYLPGGWDEEAIPFGLRDDDDPDRTIKGWIEAGAGETYKAARDRADKALAAAKSNP